MRSNKGSKRLVAMIVGIAMMAGAAGMAAAETVSVEVTPVILEAYAEYGIDAATLGKASATLNAAERRALQSIYGDDDVRAALNGVVFQELWKYVGDDETIATMTLAGRVYNIGSPDAF